MAPGSRGISDTELEILKVLWDLEEGTVRDVLDSLATNGREWAYTTAQTFLNRLQEKGFLQSSKVGRAFVFSPVVSRDELLGQSLEALAARVCDGAPMPLLLNLVQTSQFTRDDIEHFRRMLDSLEKGDE